MTRREAIDLLRRVAASVRRVVPFRVARFVERQVYGVRRDQNAIDLVYVMIRLSALRRERDDMGDVAEACKRLRDGYTIDDPRLQSMPAAARPYAVTGAKAAAGDALDKAEAERDMRAAQLATIEEALAVLELD